MKKLTFPIILGLLILSGIIVIGIRVLSGEDTWDCRNGQWVKHGKPSAPMPQTGCGR